jgi:3',5'-nucleoside bisphosphate phosphatase
VRQTHAMGGLSVSCHVDRPANGIINQLGFIPPGLELDGVEVSYRVPLAKARELIPVIGALPCITSSDAHFLQDIGRAATVFRMAGPTIAEIGLALRGEHGRGILA